jgi:hypothetical protein
MNGIFYSPVSNALLSLIRFNQLKYLGLDPELKM